VWGVERNHEIRSQLPQNIPRGLFWASFGGAVRRSSEEEEEQ
jgi:hypothetical protein